MRRPIAGFEEARDGVLGVSEPQETLRLDFQLAEGPPTFVMLDSTGRRGWAWTSARKRVNAGHCALARSSQRRGGLMASPSDKQTQAFRSHLLEDWASNPLTTTQWHLGSLGWDSAAKNPQHQGVLNPRERENKSAASHTRWSFDMARIAGQGGR